MKIMTYIGRTVQTGCLILAAWCSLLSGLCSTCEEERCDNNGKCTIGCVPGYVGRYCEKDCPPRCFNNACHADIKTGVITCTDGCVPGYCDIKCEVKCPEDCVSCDRQCDSCNVTLCNERRYGAGCSKVCSPMYGKCDRETGQCIKCKRGYYGDKCTKKCKGCFNEEENDMDKCHSGCDRCKAKVTCPTGFYGNSCDLRCSLGCKKQGRGCNKATGECSDGCVSGYHGLTCNYTCSEHCVSGKCDRATGECSDGCVSGYHGLTCNYTCSEHCVSGKCDRATGECSDGCVSGYHGLTCNYTCSEHCVPGKCDRATGECSKGCVSGYHGLICNNTCNKFCVGGICNQRNGICTSGCVSGYISNLDKCESNEGTQTVLYLLICLGLGIVAAFFFAICRRGRRHSFNNRNTQHDNSASFNPDAMSMILISKTVQFLPNEPIQAESCRDDVEMQPGESIQEKTLKILDRTTEEIEFYTAGMVRVSAVDIVLDKLNAGQRWITITGNTGDGMTTLGYLVLKEFLQNNVKVFALYKPEEYDQIAKIEGERVIMFDDRFGAFLADEHLIKDWFHVIRKLLSFNDNDIHVIFVSRKSVVKESRIYLGQFTDTMFDPSCIVDLSNIKVEEERLNIIEYHLKQENVTVSDELKEKVSKADIAHGFPHCCKLYSKLRSDGYNVDIEEFFETPLKFLDKTTKVLYENNCKELFQLMIENDGQFDVYTVEDKDKRQELLQVEKEQEGSYTTVWNNGICLFAHPSVYESVLNVINDINPLYCVQYATLSVIRQKMVISISDEEDRMMSSCYIIVRPIPAVLKALAVRFREDILTGDYSVFTHRLCQSREFCEALISCCVDTDKNENGPKQFINQPGKDGETMLMTSVKGGRMIAAQTLVKTRADVNIQDDRGRTPLHYLFQPNFPAAANDGIDKHSLIFDITKLIIAQGRGDVKVCDHYGQTPLHYFCQLKLSPALIDENQDRSDMDTLRLIITEGRGDINIPDQNGHTPLHYLFKCNAVSKEEINWILTVAKGNLNLNEQNKSTPLHHLCANSELQLDTIDLVVTEGKGDFNKGDEHGTTPLHFLCENGNFEFDVFLRIINTSKGDINKQDDNGITPFHVLCKGSLQLESILTLINQRTKADRHGNTPLHFLCRRQAIDADGLQQLEQMTDIDMKKPNVLGYTPSDYLNDQDGSLQWTDGMIDRSSADLVVCQFQQGETWTAVLGPKMTVSSENVHESIQVEDFGRQLSNVKTCGNRERQRPGQFSWFYGSVSSPVPIPPQNVITSTYWEIDSRLTWTEEKWNILLQMGLVEGFGNLNEESTVSDFPRSVCVSVTSFCRSHIDKLCIQILRRDQEWGKSTQVGECVTRSRPKPSENITFTFGLVLDVRRGLVAFIDLENERVLQTVHKNFKQEVVPTFHVPAINETFATRMRLISGREIALSDWKIKLIRQALSN